MTNFKSLYFALFNGITDVVASLETLALSTTDDQLRAAIEQRIIALRQLQLDAEERYIKQVIKSFARQPYKPLSARVCITNKKLKSRHGCRHCLLRSSCFMRKKVLSCG